MLKKDKAGKFWSCIATGKANVRYFVGKKVYPPKFLREAHYGLLVFKDYNDAINFKESRCDNNIVVREVETGRPKKILPTVCILEDLSQGHLFRQFRGWPWGTEMVSWVKVLKKTPIYWTPSGRRPGK